MTSESEHHLTMSMDDDLRFETPPTTLSQGIFAFYRNQLVQLGAVIDPEPDASYEDGQHEHPVLELMPVPAVPPTPDQVKTFKRIWNLADRYDHVGSRVALALGVTLAMPHLSAEQEEADLDSGATPQEVADAINAQKAQLDFSADDWKLILAALRATARRTYSVHGATSTIGRLNQVGDEIAVHLRTSGEATPLVDQALTEELYDPKVDPQIDLEAPSPGDISTSSGSQPADDDLDEF